MKTLVSNVITSAITAATVGLGITQLQDGKFDTLEVNKLIVKGDDGTVTSITSRQWFMITPEGLIQIVCDEGSFPAFIMKTEKTSTLLQAEQSIAVLKLSNKNGVSERGITLNATDDFAQIGAYTDSESCAIRAHGISEQ